MPHQHQQTSPHQNNQYPPSNGTGTNSGPTSAIVETLEHRRFAEFCDACRRYGYIGLCFGSPGVGKTLSGRDYSRWDKVKERDRWSTGPAEVPTLDTVFYTPSVVNAPGNIDADIRRSRDTLRDLAKRPLRREKKRAWKPFSGEMKSARPTFCTNTTGWPNRFQNFIRRTVRLQKSTQSRKCRSVTRRRSF